MATLSARSILLKTPLGNDVLLPRLISGSERVSTPFRFDVSMLSQKGDINPDQILGKNVTLTFALPSGGKRHFNGIVIEFAQHGYRSKYHEYQAVVRPWFWQLTRTADCRIFQKKSVPDIFEEVVKQYGFSGYKLKLKDKSVYKKWDYCVQYRETDFNFLSRLLEQEGIYYFFEHTESAHEMVLADDAGAHQTVSGYDSVPFFPPDAPNAQRERDHLTAWSFTKSMLPGAYATTDYDFLNPRQSLLATESIARQHALANYEVFDYPAELTVFTTAESGRIAKTRIQEAQAGYMVARGQGNAAGLATGRRFKLTEYPRKDLNIEYVIIGTAFSLASDAYDAGGGGDEAEFKLSLEAVDAKTPYRPARVTPKPSIYGAQTAVVVGPNGEEIYTDEHSRVKVQFHWDRYGKLDENSSCWVRVSQVWAGKNWGAIHIPRIGQEVVVSFLEGDPDQPIITGRVYNADNMPPYALPANKTQSGIKSRSSKGGAAANFNEIRMEDLKGSEQLFIHAEKNQDIEVENDETHWVGHDRKKTVDNDETTLVKGNRTETVNKDEKITIDGNRTEKVDKNETISITKDRKENVGDNETVTIGKDQRLTVEGNRTREVTKDEKVTVNGAQTNKVAKARKTEVGDDDQLKVGKKFVIDAGDQVTIQTGSASIVMKKDGTITIKGKDITLDGSGKINIKASSDVVIKGSKVSQN
jgi:type VI secretion system secreted protein VgrG